MANRRPQPGGRRMDFGRIDRGKNFGRGGVSPWQTTGPSAGLPNLLPLSGGPTEATLALASNIINLLQPRQNPVPSLLDMPIRRDFGPDMGRFDRGYIPNRMGNQGNFRRTGNYNRAGERINNRKPYRPSDGQRQPHKSSLKKDADSKAKPKESEQDNGANEETEGETSEKTESKEETEGKKEAPKTRYDDISSVHLKCHICNKSMWDGRSFENHLSGRAHAIMMQKTAESYALTADTMRQEFKIREMKRTRKAGQQPPRDFYCAMCDMYAGDGAVHRTTVGHRKLKKYLHPTCTCCHKEMPTRIELDEHRLTAEHLRNIQDKQEVITKPKPEVMVISTLSMEQSYLREDRQRRPRTYYADKDKETAENGPKEEQEQTDENKEQEEGEKAEDNQEKPVKKNIDSENTILDYNEGDDLTNFTSDMIPVYNTERGVGRSFISEFKCVQCKLCRKLLDSEETAEVHLRTWRHHQLFTRLLGDKAPSKQRNEPEPIQENTAKRPLNAEENGNWKRRKVGTDVENSQEDDDDKPDDNAEEINIKKEMNNEVKPDAVANTVEEELENWDETIEEILQDEKNSDELQIKEEPVEEPPQEIEKVASPPNTPVETKAKTPRGRGRGRPRRY